MIASTACSSRMMFSALSSRASAAASCAATSASSLRCAMISCAERPDSAISELSDLAAGAGEPDRAADERAGGFVVPEPERREAGEEA